MTATYDKITAYTVTGSPVSSFNITSIPGTYTDFRVILNSATGAAFDDEVLIRCNNDTAGNYSMTILGQSNNTLQSSRRSSVAQWHIDNNSPANVGGMYIMDFMDYSNTSTFKTMLSRSGRAGLSVCASVNLWRDTSAITSLNFRLASNLSYQVGTTITLYGIKAE